nr:hypothetical protein [Escherichia coli]
MHGWSQLGHRDRFVAQYWLESMQRQMMDVSRSSMQVDTHLCLFVADDDRSPASWKSAAIFSRPPNDIHLLRDIGSYRAICSLYFAICASVGSSGNSFGG